MPYKAWRRAFEWRKTNIEAAKNAAVDRRYERRLMRAFLTQWCKELEPPELISSSECGEIYHGNDDNDDDSSSDEDYERMCILLLLQQMRQPQEEEQ